MPKFVINQEYVPVSSYFIEHFLKDANGAFVKVYLYALSLAHRGADVENTQIAEALNLLESDVLQAFVYWKDKGMIIEDSGVVEFCDKPVVLFSEQIIEQDEEENLKKAKYDSIELARRIGEDQSLSELVMLAQELLSKPLTQAELETVYWLYDELGYSSEAILLLLDYCISRNKRSFKYIEKVAVTWHEQGLYTAQDIIEYINAEEEKSGYMYSIRKGMGISDRPLAKAEEEYINKWYETYGFSCDMILLAYEYCLINTSKLSFPYMDKIIERWNAQGITTVQLAQEDNKKHKSKSAPGFNAYSDEFNHDELEKLTRKH